MYSDISDATDKTTFTIKQQLLTSIADIWLLLQSKRLKQNRLAARKSRQRRKQYVECLEEEVKPLCMPWCVHAVGHVCYQPCLSLQVLPDLLACYKADTEKLCKHVWHRILDSKKLCVQQ